MGNNTIYTVLVENLKDDGSVLFATVAGKCFARRDDAVRYCKRQRGELVGTNDRNIFTKNHNGQTTRYTVEASGLERF